MRRSKKLVMTLLMIMIMVCVPKQVFADCKMSTKKTNIDVGQSVQLYLRGANSGVKWKSMKKSVAVVSSNGKVTGKSLGLAQICATYKGKTYKCKVAVKLKFKKGIWFPGTNGGFNLKINKVTGRTFRFSMDLYNTYCKNITAPINSNGKTAKVRLWCNDGYGEAHDLTFTWLGNAVRVKERTNCYEKMLAPFGSNKTTVTTTFRTEAYWNAVMSRENY